MKVAKFGGTSLASAEQIKKVCAIIQQDTSRRIVVVSAPGKRHSQDTKVTDLLIAYANRFLQAGSAEKEKQAIVQRFEEITAGLGFPADLTGDIIESVNRALEKAPTERAERYLDTIKAIGEDTSARIVATYLRMLGASAQYVNPWDAGLFVTEEAGNAQVLADSYERLRALTQRDEIIVFPGFFGYTPEGVLVTFSRGGSDITGSILAAAVRAELYENFTDVDAVYVVNPSLVSNPRQIDQITYPEMRELAYSGFSVFHEEALLPAYQAGVPVCVKNTNNPAAPGTMIVAKRTMGGNPLSGISSDKNFCSVFVSKYLMNREIGFGRKLLQIFEEEGLSYEHTPSGIDNISVIVREKSFDAIKQERVIKRIKQELRPDIVTVERDLALVMIVGEGMRQLIGFAARATSALARADVNLEMINQGASEVSMMFGVKTADADIAVLALYNEFYRH